MTFHANCISMNFQKLRLFRKAATATLIIFFGVMACAVVFAYSRQSGSTGLDMAKVQKMRYQSRNIGSKE